MTINIKLLTNKPADEYGHAIVVLVSHKQIRREREIGRAFEKNYDISSANVLENHPDYDILAPRILSIKLTGRKLILSGLESPDEVMKILFGVDISSVLFVDYGRTYADELRAQSVRFDKIGDVKKRNNLIGNARVYENVVNQLANSHPFLAIDKVSYNDLMSFRNHQESLGNSKNTVHLYLRTLRSLYNKAVKVYGFSDTRPFDGVFERLKTKSYENKKKYIDKESVLKLENMQHIADSASKYTDLWLLQFYFGGADLMDIYFLKKNQIRNGRIYFERGKNATGLMIDLLVADKALAILDKWADKTKSEWLFPWRKDVDGYKTFSRKMYGYLRKVQARNEIEVLPMGGNLGSKVARHTFATIAKQKGVHYEVLRELMGHERDEVDNYYKDRFSQEVRDKALLEIIS